jgi:cell division protein FtsB
MKKRKKTKKHDSATATRRLPALVALALVVLVIAAISAVSRQLVAEKQSMPAENTPASKDATAKKYMTVKVAGQDVQVDSQTGKLKPLTAQEAQELAEQLKKMVNKSADGLKEVKRADGSVSMDLEGRFQHVVVAREREDGTLSMSCVDTPRSAAAATGIDPKLLGVEGGKGPIQPVNNARQN